MTRPPAICRCRASTLQIAGRTNSVSTVDVPRLSSVNVPLLALMMLALVLTFVLKWGMARMLAICAAVGATLTAL
jgi:hypothetical protein